MTVITKIIFIVRYIKRIRSATFLCLNINTHIVLIAPIGKQFGRFLRLAIKQFLINSKADSLKLISLALIIIRNSRSCLSGTENSSQVLVSFACAAFPIIFDEISSASDSSLASVKNGIPNTLKMSNNNSAKDWRLYKCIVILIYSMSVLSRS